MIPNQWYAVLESKEVKPGQVTSALRMNLHLAFFRTSNGKLGCVEDRCSHRGAALSGGKVNGNCLQCPFHGLEFLPDGRCNFVPAQGKASMEDLSRFHVKNYSVREAHGMVYLWYGDKELDSGVLPFFDKHIDDGYSYSTFSDKWNSHYSRCIENQLDVVHLPFIHHNTIGRGHKTVVNGPAVEFSDGVLCTSASNELDHGQAPKKPEECSIGNRTYLCFRFPNVWMNRIAPRYKLVIFFAPIDDENTMLYIHIYSKLSHFKAVNKLIASASRLMAYIIERQDRRVVITQQPKASSYYSEEKLLVGDRPIVLYRKMREELKQLAAEQTDSAEKNQVHND